MSDFLILSDETLGGLAISPVEVADAIEAALVAEADGRVWTAPKSHVMPGDGRYVMSTLATGLESAGTVIKSVMVSPDNPGRGLPSVWGAIMLLDAASGELRAVMQSGWITAVRTAGLSAVVARRMADPASRQVAFLGAGVQARSHLASLAAHFPLTGVAIAGRGQANIDRLAAMARDLGLAVRIADDATGALDDADLIVSSIPLDYRAAPFIDARAVKPGAFATITDGALPWHPETMEVFGTVVVDDLRQEMANPKPVVRPEQVRGDLAGVVTGATPVAHDPARPGAFVFRGLAIGDFAIACLGYERARAQGAGGGAIW